MRPPAQPLVEAQTRQRDSGSPGGVVSRFHNRGEIYLDRHDVRSCSQLNYAVHDDRSIDRSYGGFVNSRSRRHIDPIMTPDLTDEEKAALARELDEIIQNDRFQFSPRISTLKGILAELRPTPVSEPLPPPKIYEPPRAGKGRRG
jgi:hypothetical protein